MSTTQPPAQDQDNNDMPPSIAPDASEKRTVLFVYFALALSLLLGVIPVMAVAYATITAFLVVWVSAYIIRKKSAEDSLARNHMTYIIRSLWIVSLISVFTVAIGSVYMLIKMDPQSLLNCLSSIGESGVIPPYEQFRAMVDPCIDRFISDNRFTLTIAGGMTIVPVLLYLLVRFGRGITCALKGLPVENVKRFF